MTGLVKNHFRVNIILIAQHDLKIFSNCRKCLHDGEACRSILIKFYHGNCSLVCLKE